MAADYLPEFAPEGNLDDLPLPVLIMHLLERRASGMLYLEQPGGQCWLYFDEGFPAGVHNPKSQDYLGQVLRELGYIDDAAFNQSLMEMAKSKRLQGEILLAAGAIDEQQLEKALSLQIARKMSRLFALGGVPYRFVEDEEIPPPQEPIRINPYALVYNGIRNCYDAERLKQGLEILVGRSCKVTGLFVERKELFDFPPEDLAAVELLREFRLPQQFVRATPSGATSGMMMLLCLLYCGMLELEEAGFAQPIAGMASASAPPPSAPAAARPAGTASSTRPATPAAKSRAPAARPASTGRVAPDLVRKINDKYEQVKKAPLWQILEVEKDATAEAIKRSFITLAKVYHPDRVSGAGDEELTHRMEVIFAKVNEAYQVLSDPNRRLAYEQQQQGAGKAGGKGTVRPEEARIQYQKGVVFLRKKNFVKAAESFRWAAELDPQNGDYHAWKVWATFLRDGGHDSPEQARLLREQLLELHKRFADSFQVAKMLARACQRSGDAEGYAKFLEVAAKLNGKDVEVARELRLLRMRREKESKKGLFGRLKR